MRGALPYATAKAAVEGLTRALAVDVGPLGIRVNAVALGSIATARYDDLLGAAGPDERRGVEAQMARLHPLGRVGAEDEVAEVVAFLLSPAASLRQRCRAARRRGPRRPGTGPRGGMTGSWGGLRDSQLSHR